ncbi:hypothetical protein PIB30_025277 [Stylosanthes scabra]|uniref:Uncharacterized protein n=1 Tax=Stylosanthes scabra TaxID=79078 RepID=A0ABU6U8W2_9FABA|nr:hypothetical protein [Stylosanthes scabra]
MDSYLSIRSVVAFVDDGKMALKPHHHPPSSSHSQSHHQSTSPSRRRRQHRHQRGSPSPITVNRRLHSAGDAPNPCVTFDLHSHQSPAIASLLSVNLCLCPSPLRPPSKPFRLPYHRIHRASAVAPASPSVPPSPRTPATATETFLSPSVLAPASSLYLRALSLSLCSLRVLQRLRVIFFRLNLGWTNESVARDRSGFQNLASNKEIQEYGLRMHHLCTATFLAQLITTHHHRHYMDLLRSAYDHASDDEDHPNPQHPPPQPKRQRLSLSSSSYPPKPYLPPATLPQSSSSSLNPNPIPGSYVSKRQRALLAPVPHPHPIPLPLHSSTTLSGILLLP